MKDKKYNIRNYPDINESTNHMEIEVNFDEITKHLLVQRIINDYYIFTGILFILIGIALCFLGIFKNIIKIIISIIFAELFILIVFVFIFDFNKKWFEILFMSIGIVLGFGISYFCLRYFSIYKVILSITAGTIFGIYLFDIIFIRSDPQLILAILIDNILISSLSFLVIMNFIKKYYIFLNSIIGGYILARGISIISYKSLRYRELQIILYFRKEIDWKFYDEKNDGLNWDLYWVYDIIIFCFIIISILFYYFHSKYYSKTFEEEDSDSNLEEKGKIYRNFSLGIDEETN